MALFHGFIQTVFILRLDQIDFSSQPQRFRLATATLRFREDDTFQRQFDSSWRNTFILTFLLTDVNLRYNKRKTLRNVGANTFVFMLAAMKTPSKSLDAPSEGGRNVSECKRWPKFTKQLNLRFYLSRAFSSFGLQPCQSAS